jgi:transcriptional regulator with XRE-family HTH domain
MVSLLNTALRRARLRYRPGVTLRDVAAELDVHPSYLTKIETGLQTKPQEDVLDRIYRAYGMPEPVRAIFEYLFEATKSGTVPSDEGDDKRTAAFVQTQLDAHPGPFRHVLGHSLHGLRAFHDFAAKRPNGESVAVCAGAVMHHLLVDGRLRDRKEREPLYHALVSEPERVFLVPVEGDTAAVVNEKAVNQASVDGLLLVQYALKTNDFIITAQENYLTRFDEAFEALRKTAVPGEQAVAMIEMMAASVERLRSDMGSAGRWKVKAKGGKVLITPPE